MRYFVCEEVSVIIIVSFALSGSVMNTIPPGCQEDCCTQFRLTWSFLACEEVPEMISVFLHSVVLWYTLITMTLAGRLFRNVSCV